MITVRDELHQVGAARAVPMTNPVQSELSAVPRLEPDDWGRLLGRYAPKARRNGDTHSLPLPARVMRMLDAHRREGETDEILVRRLMRMD